jgi:Ni,Fe-hydrogenase III large subunit
MTAAQRIREAGEVVACRPWPRHVLSAAAWRDMAAALGEAPEPALLALWADTLQVHALLRDGSDILLASVAVEAGQYAALSPYRPAAVGFERAIRDLWGHRAEGGRDARPLLDHGNWPHQAPLSARPTAALGPVLGGIAEPAAFLPVEGEELHQLALGPVLGGISEPAHFRLSVLGDTLARLELRMGYAHKGTLGLMRGKSPRAAARFAARLSGDSTVAHAVAFARAAEAAADAPAPQRAVVLRGVMAEIERIASHLADGVAVAEAAGATLAAARFGWHREALLVAAGAAFGHRLMMDCVIPGGVAADIAVGGEGEILSALAGLTAELPEMIGLREGGLAGRLAGVGVVPPALAGLLAAGGPIGRAAGQRGDARVVPGYGPYVGRDFDSPVLGSGDGAARLRLRLAEIEASDFLLRDLLLDLPAGDVAVSLGAASGEGVGCAEGARGDIWHWLRLDGGQIGSVYMRDPAWLHWPLLEAASEGISVDDFALCVASFACPVSGVDL